MAIQTVIAPHVKDLGGFQARRLLPSDEVPMVGPFIFFDHLGPATFPPGQGVDVRPHPHINLATVTYLFEGGLLHRDSLGSVQEIRPGAVNWMTAGRGIVHSERSPDADREAEAVLHGIQTWVALPAEAEETAPWFGHHPASEIPTWQADGVTVVLVAGSAYGHTSPVKTFSPILYLDLQFPQGGSFSVLPESSERAVYAVTPGVTIDGQPLEQHRLALLQTGATASVSAQVGGRAIVVGGEPVGKRYKWWNFVSSSLERIDQAKRDWVNKKFASVPKETEFIPLPEEAS